MAVIQHQAEMFILRLLRVEALVVLQAELAAAVLAEAAEVPVAGDFNNQNHSFNYSIILYEKSIICSHCFFIL